MIDDQEEVKPMKAFNLVLAGLATIVTASSAHALLKTPGSFVPVQCGSQEYAGNQENLEIDINQVCLGEVLGGENAADESAVSFRLTDGAEEVYFVSHTTSHLVATRSGAVSTLFHLVNADGEQATMKVVQAKSGEVQSVSGEIKGVTYFVPSLQEVYTIQAGF